MNVLAIVTALILVSFADAPEEVVPPPELVARAEAGHAGAQYELGRWFDNVGADCQSAVRWYERAAAQADAAALFALGVHHCRGRGVPADCARGIQLIEQAALQGHVKAQVAAGVRWAEGQGVPVDARRALTFSMMAARQGDADALYNVGLSYEEGAGVPADCPTAAQWYERAAARGHSGAMFKRGFLEERCGNPEAVVGWWKKAADAGHAAAAGNLGLYYKLGSPGGAIDLAESFRYFEKAAKGGDLSGMVGLGLAYQDGLGTVADPAEAERWLKAAADAGDLLATCNLGVLYHQGQLGHVDNQVAFRHFLESVEGGEPKCRFNLAVAYRDGFGVPPDPLRAYVWFSLADPAHAPRAPDRAASIAATLTPEQRAEADRKVMALRAAMPTASRR